MIEDIKEAALDYINSEREKNFYAANRTVTLQVFGQAVDVETIWYSKREDKVYLHCGCKEFEADVDLESLSTENQERVREVLACENITDEDVPRLMQMHDGKPLVFLFRVADVEREEVNRGMSREECFKRCAKFYTLDELGDAWNDTDDDMRCLMDVKRSWCYVSLPELPDEELRKKRERQYKATIIFGEYAANAYCNGGVEEMAEHIDKGQLTVREFETEAERRAYIMGIDDSDGWLSAAVLSKEDAESEMVKQLLDD